MIPEQYLDHVDADSARFAETCATNLDKMIDHLGWSVRELVAHLGAVYSMVIANVDNRADAPVPPGDEAQAPDGDAINEWFAERRAVLLAALNAADPDAPAWTFTGMRTSGWWLRRMASETAVHRWDASAALSRLDAVEPIDSDLAADAVDEYLAVSLQYSSSRPDRVYPATSLHLHRSDGNGEWMLVSNGSGGVTVTHEHGKGDAAVRGPASELLLWVWGRPTYDLQIFGDETVATTWQSLAP